MILTSPATQTKTPQVRQRTDVPVNGNGMSVSGTPKAVKKEKTGVAPWKIVLASMLLGIGGYFYISHVFTTQSILREVHVLQNEYDAGLRMYEDRALTYDRMTGPAEVYRRGAELGLIHGGANDPIILKRP